ncbi:tetratricopeptide repeat protein [Sulfuriferula nivalis]|uniref:Lipoprotein n=1 Tax=Sulfuriferula nivalis TaxID=2675298 RepID=A0A809SIB7_9PROT|nr:hypothetical protein [Sulfuriferula nivalis]BBP01650.1 hypothetical protein SFSGTM_23580 [Sulfuriferula nivalis]
MISNLKKSGFLVVALLSGCAGVNNQDVSNSASGIQTTTVSKSAKDVAAETVAAKTNQIPAIKFSDNATVNAAVAKADIAFKSNQPEKAYAILKEATVSSPMDKAPWLRMAQAQFDVANYGEAIVNSLEVLKRDAKDQVAKSIIVVSGLRLSTKTLADLRTQNEISGSLRTEAQDLAKILRENLGESALIAKSHKKSVHHTKSAVNSTAAPAHGVTPSSPPPASNSGNPFGALK